MKHPSGINQAIVDKVVARRGRLHAYTRFEPKKTALVVIDLDVGTVRRMQDEPGVDGVLARVNELARAVRRAGGVVTWTVSPMGSPGPHFRDLYGDRTTEMYEKEAVSGEAATVSLKMDMAPEDIRAAKEGHSAFFPGKCDLHEQLRTRAVDTVFIAGTVTNVCCESSARDADELGYKVVMVSDALKGHGNGLHEASLATIFRNFGDVRPASEVLLLLGTKRNVGP